MNGWQDQFAPPEKADASADKLRDDSDNERPINMVAGKPQLTGPVRDGEREPPFPDFIPQTDFPWRALPATIRGAVLEICENDKLALPLAVQATFAAVSISCQDQILVDRGFGEPTVCSLFLLTVADSGARKTRADRAVTPTIEAIDRGWAAEYERAKTEFENDEKTHRMKEGALERTYASLARKAYGTNDDKATAARQSLIEVERLLDELRKQKSGRVEPRLRRSLYSSISMRELERSLCENWPSAGLVSSEAADILNARGESDMARLDRLWDGLGIDVVGRTARESFSVSDPRLTISLMIQPTVFDRFIDRRGEQAKGIGFIPRMLISRPETPYGYRQANSTASRSTVWIDRFNRRVLDLLKRAQHDIARRAENRRILYFSAAAQQLWDADHNDKEAQTVETGQYVHEREFVNRYSEHVARLAALFHFFASGHLDSDRSGRDEIAEPTLKSAIEVCQWYLKEFGRIFNPDVAIEEAATYALTKLKERVASKNGGQIPEMATYGNQNVEMPENELRLFCSRYGLKSDAQKFKMALDWLERRRLVSRYAKPNAATRRSTDMVRLEIKMRSWRDNR